MGKKANILIFFVFILFAFSACNKDEIYNSTHDIKGSKWDASNVINFNFQVEDTLQPYDVFINLRHNSQYNYRNLFLFVKTTSPAGHTVKDTFECMLADKKGHWYGKGWGDIYENKIPFKRFVRFPNTGTYSIEVKQAMREETLENISDIGIEIETAKQPEN
ncbi:MAG: gliding motility lipoprotein GldH [Bacteroidota bacterium]